MIFYETSAKNNVNVEMAFQALIKKVIKRQEDMNKILGSGDGSKTAQPGQKIQVNNMNRRMNRSTKTKLESSVLDGANKKKGNCAKCN